MTVSTPIVPDSNATLASVLGRARTQQLSLAELFQMAEGLAAAGQAAQAIELYKTWIAFNDGTASRKRTTSSALKIAGSLRGILA